MRTRSSRSTSPFRELADIPRRTRGRSAPSVVPELRTEPKPPVIMADDRPMNELLQAPTEGYGDAIVVPAIAAENFELKTGLINLATQKQFYGFDRDNPHDHIRWFNQIIGTIKCKNVPEESIKLLLFPFSIEGNAKIWLDKQPPKSIETWGDLVHKFINEFFPPSKTTFLKNEIMKFSQRFDEPFGEAWDRFKELLRRCPHHGFTELMQMDTFYNGLNPSDQNSLNASAGGNFLSKSTKEAIALIENMSKVRTTRDRTYNSHASAGPSTSSPVSSSTDSQIAELTKAIQALVSKKESAPQTSQTAEVKKVEVCVTCGGPHPYYNCTHTAGNAIEVNAVAGSSNQGGIPFRPQMETNYRANNQGGQPGLYQPNNANRFIPNQQRGQNP
jgi:hypothetical protein